MKFVLFYHSFVSCWNHGNAHFLRGVARELVRLGHDVRVHEPEDGWSRANAVQDAGPKTLDEAANLVPGVELHAYRSDRFDLEPAVEHADVVIAHEWNAPEIVAALGRRRLDGGRFLLLFHDTHHRAVTAPDAIDAFDLDGYDGVLAFGEVLRQMYLDRGWGRRALTWHEAADIALFRPLENVTADTDLVWIGNWGDGEREIELQQFLIEPVARLGIRARVHGVRYPHAALAALAAHGLAYQGWLPNHRVPDAFARARATIHVPRRPYVETLPGIPTIRVFEALACGIPLVCAPWSDTEALFPRTSYLTATNSEEMTAALSRVLQDRELAAELARSGLGAIRARHTCAHRVRELLQILNGLGKPTVPAMEIAQEQRVCLS
jgi:spore maturation protein CgeB